MDGGLDAPGAGYIGLSAVFAAAETPTGRLYIGGRRGWIGKLAPMGPGGEGFTPLGPPSPPG